MLDFDILQMIVFSAVYSVFWIVHLWKKWSVVDHLVFTVFYGYLVALVAVTIYPIPIQANLLEQLRMEGLSLPDNWVPFASMRQIVQDSTASVMLKQLVGNVLLLLPLGFFIPLLQRKKVRANQVILLGFMGAILIEVIQKGIGLLIGYNYRSFDLDDVILNTVGVIVGYVLFCVAEPFLRQKTGRSSR